MPRYYDYPQRPLIANPSISAGLFTPNEQLRVDGSSLSDAGQFRIAAPTVPSGYDHTWTNEPDPIQQQYDPVQRAAMTRSVPRGTPPLTDDPQDNALLAGVPDATNLALNLRRLTDSQQPVGSRYAAFAAQPHLARMLEPQKISLYRAAYGHSPDEETALRVKQMEAMEKEREFRLKPREETFKQHAAIAAELGFKPEEFAQAYEDATPEQKKLGFVNLPGRYQMDPFDPQKEVYVPGRRIPITERNKRIADYFRQQTDQYLPAAPAPMQGPPMPTDAEVARARWQELEDKAKAEAAAAQAARSPASATMNYSRFPAMQ